MTTAPLPVTPRAHESARSAFPWFGGKADVASYVWKRFGDPANYIEPFAGSLAVLLARPDSHQWWNRIESVNDLDAHISNWFRSVAADPHQVARHASAAVNETDLTARHLWLVQNQDTLRTALTRDPGFYDARAAGWWVYGISCWVGGDWCSGIGPLTGSDATPISRGGTAPGVYRKLPMMAGHHRGKGIHRPRKLTQRGIDQPPPLTAVTIAALAAEFEILADRLRRVRVACGAWDRLTKQVAEPLPGHHTAVLLDPPYDLATRRGDLYASLDRAGDRSDAHIEARTWALDTGTNPAYRIAYCTYANDEETDLFTAAGWDEYRWSAQGGYAAADNAKANRTRETIWFSPACIPDNATHAEPTPLF